MKKRGLWEASPRYLGVVGDNRWEDDLLEDLLFSCYEFIFIRRLPGLVKHLKAGGNVDGLVFLDIQHFLHETQRRHDPLGYRIFDLLRGAVQQLVTAKALFVVDGDPRLRKHTRLAFSSWCLPEEVPELDLSPMVHAWNESLLPELVTAWNREGITRQLADRIRSLEHEGIPGFRFGDLLSPLKIDVRNRWLAIGLSGLEAEGLDPLSAGVQKIRPDLSFEERQRFDRLLQCTENGLDRLQKGDRTKDYLRRLFLFLQSWAAEEPPGTGGDSFDNNRPRMDLQQIPENVPSDKRLGELLQIPRARIPGLKAVLGDLLDTCRDQLDSPGATSEFPSSRRNQQQNRRQSLRQATARAAASLQRAAVKLGPAQAAAGPTAGDLYVLQPDLYPGQWVVLEREASRVHMAPIDDFPLAGSDDLKLGEPTFPPILRGGYSTWAPSDVFAAGYFAGRLGPFEMEQVHRHLQGLPAKNSAAPGEIDQTTEYQEWMDRLREFRRSLELVKPGAKESPPTVSPFTKAAPRHRWPVALAASLAAASLALSLWLARDLQRPEPRIFRTSSSQDLRFLDVKRGGDAMELQEDGEDTLVYLDLSLIPKYSHYRLEIVLEQSLEIVWAQDRVEADRELILALPHGSIGEGLYFLRISGEAATGDVLELAKYSLRIGRDPKGRP